MRVTGSFAFAAFIGGASALSKLEPSKSLSGLLELKELPQMWWALQEQPNKPAQTGPRKPPAKKSTGPCNRQCIWRGQMFDGTDIPKTAYGYPYCEKTPDVVAAEEEATACKNDPKCLKGGGKTLVADKEARARARMRELQAKQENHQATARALKKEVKAAAVEKHLKDVLKFPPHMPVEWAEEETPESAEAPWPPHEEEEEAPPQMPGTAAAENAEAGAAGSGLSAAVSRPAVQVGAQEERRKTERQAKLNSHYFRKCTQKFAGLDFDGDSAIEEEEVFAFFDAAWNGYDPAELTQRFLAEADQDRDGQVSTAEWYTFANEAQKSSRGKAERWDPLQHLKRGVSSDKTADMTNATGQSSGYHKRISTRLFRVMDVNKNDIASEVEMQAFLGKKYPMKDPVEFSKKVLAEADSNGDSNVTMTEFLNFAELSRERSTNLQEKWNPLLHIIGTVRRNSAFNISRSG